MCRLKGHSSSACRSWFVIIPIACAILVAARSRRDTDPIRHMDFATLVSGEPGEINRPLPGGPPRPAAARAAPATVVDVDVATVSQSPPLAVALIEQETAKATAVKPQVVDAGSPLQSSSWSDTPQELSVEPGTLPLLPDDAPAWIGSLPDYTGPVHHLHVGGLVADSEAEAATLLDDALVAAVKAYVETHVLERPRAAAALSHKLTADYVWKNLIDDPHGYVAQLNTSGQSRLFQKWVTVSITPQQRQEIVHWDREATQRKRLEPIGVGMVGLLGCVGLFHLLLKVGKPR